MSRRVVITGASSGIGLACAHAFIDRGDRVLGLSRSGAGGQAMGCKKRERFDTMRVDVSQPKQIEQALSEMRSIDALVINAGVCEPVSLSDPNAIDNYRRTMAVNIDGAFYSFVLSLPRLSSNASVVFVSSGLGKRGRARYSAYSASKHAMLGLMRSAALELASRGVRVNAVCPGWVDTRMASADIRRAATESGLSPLRHRAQIEAAIPIGRFVKPAEVAYLVSWLCSTQAGGVTGQAFNIAGGEFSS